MQGVTSVVKILAPIALEALAKAAEALLAGAAYAQHRARLDATGDEDDGSIISTDTWQYCETNFASQYGYYYQGLRSQPTTGDLPIAAAEDIIVWDKNNGISDITNYLQTVFKDSINPGDSIEISQNLGTLFADRFKEESLSWTPFSKRYNFPDGLIVDCYMVTASAHDVNDNPAGVASYCFVAYNHGK
ncbi:hypothetical protein ACFQV2_21925 [Actinokineospora soli]|uniref:Uncharacterized protein n=1 Tax=Actinokineospora soli TaxID=1048753 RepID=A0ABW2TRE3_9PSEU